MGAKPRPTALKIIEGNRGKKPLNENEPEYETSDIAPLVELDEIASTEWKRVAPMLATQGVLTDPDRAALAGYCAAYGTFIAAELAMRAEALKEEAIYKGLLVKTHNGMLIQNPILGVRNTALLTMNKFAVELGMTPSSRTRVKVGNGKTKKKDPASKYGFG